MGFHDDSDLSEEVRRREKKDRAQSKDEAKSLSGIDVLLYGSILIVAAIILVCRWIFFGIAPETKGLGPVIAGCIAIFVLIRFINDVQADSEQRHHRLTRIEIKLDRLLEEIILPDAEREEIRRKAAAWDARVIAERAAMERTERNREIKRRAKQRKTEGQQHRLLKAVAETQVQERLWRDQKAHERGWPVHPNDMELSNEERRVMLRAWNDGDSYNAGVD